MLAFLEIGRRRQQLRGFAASRAGVTVFAEPLLLRIEMGAPGVVGGHELTPEERLDLLERRLDEDVPEQIRSARDTAVERAGEVLRPVIDSASQRAAHDVEEVRAAGGLLVGEQAGVCVTGALIVLGLLIQTAGGVVGNLACA